MRAEHVESDLTVIGGGLAGCCAAIAAARQGAQVALVQNRPVLGGNSSSEVRVWVCGATAHGEQRFARETGIMGELWLENQFTNPDGNPYYWDLVLLEAVRAEPNIALFLNTDVREVTAHGADDERTISSVTGWMMGSERLITFTSPAFVDCSGDGLVGHLAGAWYRTGCEARSEYGESWAPEVPDDTTLGSTILFYSTDAGHPVPFVPPSFALDIHRTTILQSRVIRAEAKGCAYWWIEWGGDRDVVHDNEEIRDELQAAVYGIWDHIKNSGEFDAENLTLEWIGAVPGKREYRRFVGDHTLTQHDVLGQTEFVDRVAFGGWSIDLHPPGGMYAAEPGSRHWYSDGNYHIPLRSLYSRNVTNMWMAGRTISASHVAFGTTRVMATCAVGGEAAGLAAALAVQRGLTPRELTNGHMDSVHRAMIRADGPALGVAATDPADLVLAARATASSTMRALAVEVSDGTDPLDVPFAMVLPADPALGELGVLLDAERDTELVVEVHSTGKPQNYLPAQHVDTVRTPVSAGEKQWVQVDVGWRPDVPQNAFVVLRANEALAVHRGTAAEPGTLFFRHRTLAPGESRTEQWRPWKRTEQRAGPCLRVGGPMSAYAAEHVRGGFARPYGGPQMWVSEPLDHDPAPWVELRWDAPVTVAEVAMVLDDDVEDDLINLHHHRTSYAVVPTLLRDYEVQVDDSGAWRTVARVQGNRRRHRVHRLDGAVTTARMRVQVIETNGAARAHIVSVRAYGPTG
jgi:hypothetical protein